MATTRWIGNAPKIAQVTAYVFGGTWEATDVINLTFDGKKILSVVAGSTTISTIVDNIVSAWNLLADDGYREFAEITASRSSNSLILTMDSAGAGKPFTCTVSTTETGGGGADAQTIDGGTSSTGTNSTANSGPNVVSLAANWSNGEPADGDDVIFDSGNVDVLYDLDQNGVTPASITRMPGYTGNIGLPPVNTDNQSYPYNEYREQYLKWGNSGDATNIAVTIRGDTGGRTKISTGTSQATFRVEGTGQSDDSNVPACLLKGTHASNALHVSKGDVGFAHYGGEAGTLLTLNVGYMTNVAGDSTVRLGAGGGVVTLTAPTIVVTGGTLEINSAITSTSVVTQYDGTVKLQGTGGIAAGLTVAGGTFIYSSTGTLGGAPVVSGTGHLDFSQDLRAKTVTNAIDLFGDKAKISDPHKSVGTLVIDLNQTRNTDNIEIGSNVRITRGAVA